jgi:hypothetical protein
MESVFANKKPPHEERINYRLIGLSAVVLFLIGYPVYQYVDAARNHGVKKVGDLNVVDLKALGNFPFDDKNGTIADVPPMYRELDSKKVVLEGFPYLTKYSDEEVPQFELVYNISKCCFGGPPKVQERVYVHTRDGSSVPAYFYKFASIEGTLHVQLKKEAGLVTRLYDLDIDKISPIQ